MSFCNAIIIPFSHFSLAPSAEINLSSKTKESSPIQPTFEIYLYVYCFVSTRTVSKPVAFLSSCHDRPSSASIPPAIPNKPAIFHRPVINTNSYKPTYRFETSVTTAINFANSMYRKAQVKFITALARFSLV